MGLPTVAAPDSVKVCRINLGQMSKPYTHIRRATQRFRNQLEAAVLEARGSIGLYDASRIHSAAVALREHARLDRILNTAKDGMLTLEQKLALSDRIIRHKEACDRALLALGLNAKDVGSLWNDVLSMPSVAQAATEPQGKAQACPTEQNAAEHATDTGNGIREEQR